MKFSSPLFFSFWVFVCVRAAHLQELGNVCALFSIMYHHHRCRHCRRLTCSASWAVQLILWSGQQGKKKKTRRGSCTCGSFLFFGVRQVQPAIIGVVKKVHFQMVSMGDSLPANVYSMQFSTCIAITQYRHNSLIECFMGLERCWRKKSWWSFLGMVLE